MADADPLIDRQVSHYTIHKRLGKGGMGSVYRAWDITLERNVAIKFMAPHLATNVDYIERFFREARAAAMLTHPNLIAVHDAGSEADSYFIVMELVEGISLDELLKRSGAVSEVEAIHAGVQAASGLASAHNAGIIHRDVKPSNLILSIDGYLKVSDLGLAKQLSQVGGELTATEFILGTPSYISPEQIKNSKNVDARSDIYSLGASLYHLVTGKIPFEANSAVEIMVKHLEKIPEPPNVLNPSLSGPFCELIMRMLEKSPEERIQSMEQLEWELRQMVETAASTNSKFTSAQASRIKSMSPAILNAAAAKDSKVADPKPSVELSKILTYAGVTLLLLVIVVFSMMIWNSKTEPVSDVEKPIPVVAKTDVPPVSPTPPLMAVPTPVPQIKSVPVVEIPLQNEVKTETKPLVPDKTSLVPPAPAIPVHGSIIFSEDFETAKSGGSPKNISSFIYPIDAQGNAGKLVPRLYNERTIAPDGMHYRFCVMKFFGKRQVLELKRTPPKNG